jgi:hypothetical protein
MKKLIKIITMICIYDLLKIKKNERNYEKKDEKNYERNNKNIIFFNIKH